MNASKALNSFTRNMKSTLLIQTIFVRFAKETHKNIQLWIDTRKIKFLEFVYGFS
jgi:hypothetical protein